MKKLNLGCGYSKASGYINIDNRPEVEPDVCCDLVAGLPYEDSTIDEIRAYDFLEHIPILSTISFMDEMWRVLKPGGLLDTLTPDAEHGQAAFMDPTHINFWTEGRWQYFTIPAHRRLYGIKANFEVEHLRRILTDPQQRVYHLHVVARAVK